MKAAPTLYVAISMHGYGHIGQTAPVVNELWHRMPDLKVVIECPARRELLEARFKMPFVQLRQATDFGMVMKDAFEVDVDESYRRYVELHADFERHVREARARLEQYQPDAVFSDVPYVPLLAAKQTGVPSIAMSCLNWAEIFHSLCGDRPKGRSIYSDMLQAYRSANSFIAPTPSMSMNKLDNLVAVGPIASIGLASWVTLRKMTGAPADERLVTVSMGGTATELDLARWPVIPKVTWLFDKPDCPKRPDMIPIPTLGMPYLDVATSCDALVTKPGYGSFVEAACAGVPVVSVPRPQWPEAPALVQWLATHGRYAEVQRSELMTERLGEALDKVWHMPPRPPVQPSGIREAVDLIAGVLRERVAAC